MRLQTSDTDGGSGGITNTGFWGIPVWQGGRYELSVYLRHPGSDQASTLAPSVQPCLAPLLAHRRIACKGLMQIQGLWAGAQRP